MKVANVSKAWIEAGEILATDAAYVSRTAQVRIQTAAARASGRTSVLVTGENTRRSEPARQAFDEIVRRSDLGPK